MAKSLLNPERDKLKGDELQGDGLLTYDPLSPENDQIATYEKGWGFAVTPEQKDSANAYKGEIDRVAAEQRAARDSARNQFQAQMAAGDQQAAGILGKARDAAGNIPKGSMDLVPVRVVDGSGKNVEGTYTVPREVAENIASSKGLSSSWVDGGKAFNVSTRVEGGRTRGQELHDALRDAQSQTQRQQSLINKQYDASKKAAGMQIGALEKQIASERNIAQQGFAQMDAQAQAAIAETEAKWPTFISDMQQKFVQGRETNTGGIRDLLDSGALVMKGAAK